MPPPVPPVIEIVPQPSAPTTPQLTPDTRAVDKDLGVSPPGAGGWTPKQRTAILYAGITGLGAACVQLGAAPLLDLRAAILAVGAGAVSAGGTFIGIMSAGPRKVTE